MTSEQKQDLVRKSLTLNVNLSDEEYAELMAKADAQTKNNGIAGRAPRNESVRARRMSMNYYGTATNILLNLMLSSEDNGATLRSILAELKTLNEMLAKAMNVELVEDSEVQTEQKGD